MTAFAVAAAIAACGSRSTPTRTGDGVPRASSGVDRPEPPVALAAPRSHAAEIGISATAVAP